MIVKFTKYFSVFKPHYNYVFLEVILLKIVGDNSLWVKKNKQLGQTYPTLSKNIETDVVIVGGGSTGALASYYLMKENVNCVLVDKFEVGMNATSVTTAILQYEIDNNLFGLSSHIGEDAAKQAFLFDYQAVMEIGNIVKDIKSDCDFNFTPCFYYTNDDENVDMIKDECKARQAIGIYCDLFTPETHESEFSFDYKAGIYSHYGAATIDPLKFTRDLITHQVKQGLNVFEHTNIIDFDLSPSKVILTTEDGYTITASKVIMCTGYETIEKFNLVDDLILTRTFTVATKPVSSFEGWKEKCIIRDDKDPYTYLRTTGDDRIIIGGKDMKISKLDDQMATLEDRHPLSLQAYHQLTKRARHMFPNISDIQGDCWFNGFFAETKDSLPLMGPHPDYPGAYFVLGYGSNGILYSTIGAKLIAQHYKGLNPRDLDLYSFTRFNT